MAEPKRVTLDDIVEVLAKNASTPVDPDDADTITRFNQQVAEDKEKAATPATPPQKGKASA